MTTLRFRHVKFRDACAFVAAHHRHHKPPQGHIISCGAFDGCELVGVAMLGRPVSRRLDDGSTWELTRLCVLEDRRNLASWLCSRARRVCDLFGVRMVTYTKEHEGGASMLAAGMLFDGQAGGGEWGRSNRPRVSENVDRKKRWVSP